MRNIKLILEYDGKGYFGWQTQKKKHKTLQATLENALCRILSKNIRVIGSGRTDTGVHAFSQVVNFKTTSTIPVEKLKLALNAVLPEDIVVTELKEVDSDFHAIFSAKSKIYRYTILNRAYRSALLRDRVYFCRFPLDVNLMRKEARCLVGRHDFKAFCSKANATKNTLRTIGQISIKELPYNPLPINYNLKPSKESSIITIDIEADGFLYKMVRNIVGTLIEIGRGRFPKGSMKRILYSKNRKLAGSTAPANGLCLVKVNY